METSSKNSSRLSEMIALVQTWANINTHTQNFAGIEKALNEIAKACAVLKPNQIEFVKNGTSLGLFLKKRAEAKIQIFLGGHVDTVFSVKHPFQKVSLGQDTIQGPGVADMKGGLVVLIKALEQFENSPSSGQVGWEIFVNSDEEIGSPESTSFIQECAKRCDVALLFEPALADGTLISARKGSANYTIYSKGKKAHAGRDAHLGKNAIYPLAHLISQAEKLHRPHHGTLVNVGFVNGGEALNIIPDYATCGINIRSDSLEDLLSTKQSLILLAKQYQLEITETSLRPPKPLDKETEFLLKGLKKCGSQLGIPIQWRSTGGVCDGNTLAACGIPTIDTLGVCGGEIHTEHEYLKIASLSEKTDLTALFLHEIACETIPIQRKRK
jgi:glutamate carboxypeptidase